MMRLLAASTLFVLALPLQAQETRFARTLESGDRLEIRNVNGPVRVTQASGSQAEVIVTKRVKRGNGELVKAILEEERGVMRVCTIYLNQDPNRTTCEGRNSISQRRGDDVEVEMRYEVRVPKGVQLDGKTINGGLMVEGVDTPARLVTVNGSISFDGVGAHDMETVNGAIEARFTRAEWSGAVRLKTVNGAVTLSLPEGTDLTLEGRTMNGGINSDFPITMQGRWGPRSFRGTIGRGGRERRLETINGGVTIRKL
jgi:DUF4097 and DUF4098 domain-containing protein YvlB